MNNQNIIALPASVNYTPEQALLSALEFARDDNLTDVVVIGYDTDGVLVIRSSKMTRAVGLFMIEKAKQWTLGGEE
jgi:hypothetical protein